MSCSSQPPRSLQGKGSADASGHYCARTAVNTARLRAASGWYDDVYAVAAAPGAALAVLKAEMTSLPNFSMEPITLSYGMVSVCIINMT